MREFFSDYDNARSMTRLCYFIACCVSSVAVLWHCARYGMGEGLLGVYLGTFGAVYASNKYQERKASNREPGPGVTDNGQQ